ncbi:50S ribosomal protein L44e [archaeon CG10_big_fil_rev_8_21_14_0_10_43_11]|nr:MAG: 50S ribosomal protein L44e [archaeon CG10_big_fil_rev_8_21_14_0_10_43_11]
MKVPRSMKRYCPTCKTHEEQKVVRVKARAKNPLGRIERIRSARIQKGYGSTPYPQPQKSKRHKKKLSKKPDIRFECKNCKKQHPYQSSKRTKKFELV